MNYCRNVSEISSGAFYEALFAFAMVYSMCIMLFLSFFFNNFNVLNVLKYCKADKQNKQN